MTSGYLHLGTTSLVGWPSRRRQVQSEWSVQHFYAALKQIDDQDDEIPFADLDGKEKQRRARTWVERIIFS